MHNNKIISILLILLFINAFSPLHSQSSTLAPSKFDMKKDGDGDGVKNKRDKCPSTPPGVFVDGTGCPLDTDKDGVADYLDKCPSLPGSEGMNGCQDKDNDGVSDIDDLCMDVPGLSRFKGCPDSDADGIEDSKDKCPNAKGLDMFMGCPDTDGDGIEDTKDKCPDTKTGIKVDAFGCTADTDIDGVLDIDDKCPGTKMGVKVDTRGCPADTIVKKEVPKRLKFATRRISFETGNALVKVGSYPMLDEVANILNEYPDYNLRIGGHTDAVEKNGNTLSESRADAVKSYLLSKGVAESRVMTAMYGKTRPMSSNANATARAQNRRVELELYLQ
jgi:OmpA-OmpF porin, OOP family